LRRLAADMVRSEGDLRVLLALQDIFMHLAGGTGTDDGNCLTALAEPQVRCLLEGFKARIGGRLFNLRPASDRLEYSP
jgi:hypothetical protein